MALAPGVVARFFLSPVGEVSSLSRSPPCFPDMTLQPACSDPADELETICGGAATDEGVGGLF